MLRNFNASRIIHRISVFVCPDRQLHVRKIRPASCCPPLNTVLARRVSSLPDKKEQDESTTPDKKEQDESTTPDKKEHDRITIYEKFGKIKHIYTFPYIAYCNWVVNLKWYVLPMFLCFAFYIEDAASRGMVDVSETDALVIACIFVMLKCNLLAIPFTNFIAHVYVTPERETVLSYLNIMGSRIDEKFPKGDLLLQSRETGLLKILRKDTFYMLVRSRSTRRVFRINFKHCDMFDEDLFIEAIGKIPESAVA